MSFTPEAKVKKRVVSIIKAAGAYYFFPVMNGYGRVGIPDIIVCHNGKFAGIECKAGDNKPTELQEKEMAAIRQSGGVTLVVNEQNLDAVSELLEKMNGSPVREAASP